MEDANALIRDDELEHTRLCPERYNSRVGRLSVLPNVVVELPHRGNQLPGYFTRQPCIVSRSFCAHQEVGELGITRWAYVSNEPHRSA